MECAIDFFLVNSNVELLKNAINMKNIHCTDLKSILNDSLENSTCEISFISDLDECSA